MKIAFVGKGGSGKTTLSALFIRHLAAEGLPVLAFDADINQHLGAALGLPEEISACLVPLGQHLDALKDYLRGDNPRITSAAEMIKTTPPGRGSRLLRVGDHEPLWERYGYPIGGAQLLVTGPFAESDLGVACYHSKVGAVELLLNHLVDGPDEYVVVDMTAGADAFASGLFTRFDQTVLVVEPTRKSVGVYHQYRGYAAEHDVAIAVVGNKVVDDSDVAFLREQVGSDLLGYVGLSPAVRAAERGAPLHLDDLAPGDRATLAAVRSALDATPRDWHRYTRQAVDFHLRNAAAWGDQRTGGALADQVDPDFVLGPQALTH
ncbi:ATP-binding protein [Cryptosporangium aurantiacum]|uniref:CO dehydrogenase maturation factor n=1 Tax=Cryptosporangium aurantiacum TaxID=134849 RepID=A0A1M7RN12_9ACTN|nr:ATP-binding protein [Cryptosporangium aurantiacum]SHN47580.1 CO dehydrogenase maturation factor [Cryptosporangium aurantiacum]